MVIVTMLIGLFEFDSRMGDVMFGECVFDVSFECG